MARVIPLFEYTDCKCTADADTPGGMWVLCHEKAVLVLDGRAYCPNHARRLVADVEKILEAEDG